MTQRLLSVNALLLIALTAAVCTPLRADVNINDIRPSVGTHHPRHKPLPKPKPLPPAPSALTVSRAEGSKYATIHSALAVIASGGTITIEPGDYVEDFVLTKPVTLRIDPAAKPGSVIVESASQPTLLMQTSTASVYGIHFRTSTVTSGRAAVLVEIAKGALKMGSCDIGPAAVSSLWIHGVSATPTLTGCIIHDGGHESLLISDSAAPTLTGCTITGGANAAIDLEDNCAPTFSQCTIKGGAWDGKNDHELGTAIYTNNSAGGSFADCSIGPAGGSGVLALGGPTQFTRCRIHDCGRDGGTLKNPSACVFDHCDIGPCKSSGLAADGCGLTVTSTHLHNCGNSALLAMNAGGSATIADSDFASNGDHDIAVLNSAAADITRCKIHSSRSLHSGIFVNGSSAKVNDSDIAAAHRAAIESNTSTLVVNGGKIHDLPDYGVICDHNALATFTGVEMAGIGAHAIWVGNGSDAEVIGCTLYNLHADGIDFFHATGLVTDSKITHVKNTGIAIWQGNHTITKSLIDGAKIGVGLNEHASADLTDCTISNWKRQSIDKGDGSFTVTNCALIHSTAPSTRPRKRPGSNRGRKSPV